MEKEAIFVCQNENCKKDIIVPLVFAGDNEYIECRNFYKYNIYTNLDGPHVIASFDCPHCGWNNFF